MAQNTAEKNCNLKITIQSIIIHSNDILSGTNVHLKTHNAQTHSHRNKQTHTHTHAQNTNLYTATENLHINDHWCVK